MPSEETLEISQKEIEKKIKMALLKRDMTQRELSDLLKVNRQQVNRAIKGDTAPKSTKLRARIYKILGLD